MIGKIFPRKLNKEAEISLIKPDEMMDALNVLASGGEGNDASLVKKAHGNIEALANDSSNLFQDEGGSAENVIGQVVDESSQRIYYFTKGTSSESVYLAEQVAENNIKITLLLRDNDLGFDKYVAADIIKTPKKDISFLTQDGTFSGESGDGTDIFDFQFEGDSTTVVENQTFITVTAPPNFFTSPLYDGSEKIFFGQLSVKNIGSEAGEVTVNTSITSGNLDNVFFMFDATSESSVSINLSSNQTAVIPFRAIIAANVDPADGSYGFNFLVEETPGPNSPSPLSVEYDRVIGLEFLTPSYPVQIKIIPTALTGGLEDDPSNIEVVESLANLSGNSPGLLAGIQTPETSFTSPLGFINIEVTIQSELEAGSFLPEMSLRVGAAGGTDGDYEGSSTGVYSTQEQIVSDQLSPFSSINFDLLPSDFTNSADGKTATKLVYIGRSWDTNDLEGVVVNQPITATVINGETGTPFGLEILGDDLGQVVAQDNAPFYAISYIDVRYTIANVPTPVSVTSLDGAVEGELNLDSRVYSATEDALIGGSSDEFFFQVINSGESDGYFNISIDPMVNAHSQARSYALDSFGTGSFPFINGGSIGKIISSWYNGMEIDYSVNNTSAGTVDQTNATKPNFVKTFTDNEFTYGTGNPFNFFEFRDGLPNQSSFTGFPWHATEADQSWIFIPAGAQATVKIRMSNLTMGVYPAFPTFENGFGVWSPGSSPLESNGAQGASAQTAIVFPKKNNQGVGPSFLFENYEEAEANRPLPFLSDGTDAGNFMGETASSNPVAKNQLLAAPIWKEILSKIYIKSSPTGSFDDATMVGAGSFTVNTIESIQPELLVYASGNYAHSTSLTVVGYETNTSVSTPIINSYFPIQYPPEVNGGFAIVPPNTNQQANENTNSGDLGNFISEIFPSTGSSITETQSQQVLLNHYGRQNGLPIHLGVYSASITTGGGSPTIELTANTPASLIGNVGTYGPFGPHVPTQVTTPAGSAEMSGSIGTGYCGSYASGENMFAANGASGVGDNFFNANNVGAVMTAIVAPAQIYSGSPTLIQSPETPSIGYENSFFGATPSHGRFRRISLSMAPGSFLTLQPSHMIGYNFSEAGQLDPNTNTSSLSDTIGYTIKHTIIASGFQNEGFFAGTDNVLCTEHVHSSPSLFAFHATGTPPDDGDISGPDDFFQSGNLPPEVGDRGVSPVEDEGAAAENPTDPVSLNLPSKRGSDERIEDQVKMADALKRSGISSNKKKRY